MMDEITDAQFEAYVRHSRLRNIFPNWRNGVGIFDNFTDTPWGESISNESLCLDYFGLHSGYKRPTRLVTEFLELDANQNPVVSQTGVGLIAKLLQDKFMTKWKALWDAYMEKYVDPFVDFSITEKLDGNTKDTKDGTDTLTFKGSEIDTREFKDLKDEEGGKTTVDNTKQGVVTYAQDGKEIRNYKGAETVSQAGTERETQYGKVTEADSGSDTSGIWGLGTATEPANANKVTFGKQKTTEIKEGESPLVRETSYGTGTNERKETKAFSNDRADETEYDNRKDTQTFGDGTNPLTESNETTHGRTTTRTGSIEDTKSFGTDENARKNETSYDSSLTTEYDTTRTIKGFRDRSQWELLKQYIDAWRNNFFDVVYADIDSVIALQVY